MRMQRHQRRNRTLTTLLYYYYYYYYYYYNNYYNYSTGNQGTIVAHLTGTTSRPRHHQHTSVAISSNRRAGLKVRYSLEDRHSSPAAWRSSERSNWVWTSTRPCS